MELREECKSLGVRDKLALDRLDCLAATRGRPNFGDGGRGVPSRPAKRLPALDRAIDFGRPNGLSDIQGVLADDSLPVALHCQCSIVCTSVKTLHLEGQRCSLAFRCAELLSVLEVLRGLKCPATAMINRGTSRDGGEYHGRAL